MAELAHFKNFAKLKDTSVEFNDITVLAGKPGTGKSYVMKFFYAIEETFSLTLNIKKEELEILEDFLEKSKNRTQIEIEELSKELFQKIKMKEENELLDEIELRMKNILNSIFINLHQISSEFSVDFAGALMKHTKETFNMSSMFSESRRKITDEVVFVETPLILEFHKHLDRRESKTPYHIESLINILDEDYSFTDDEQDELIKRFSKKANKIIGGDIKSRNGSFVFRRNDNKDYNIFNASSGTKSIGLLQYLVTNKALKKGSILFWEEPEVHLHPEWQLRIVELFIELMNAGVKIVFSTHSPYMADYLNAISKKRKISERVSFNLFQEKDGVVSNHILKDKKDWKKIQTELLDPLEEIMWEYL
ncbi:MAG: ABC transporter ATP-binding protein [uncultured Sulfurovum sp.]|uniref:ABC transporter ATP-binding protein n=1 Tax=uncultured Sulfurovum sp. TaxID=269237 RepID=A0A6S6TSB0_9BACT|nr:MAG: ABC transporter ATP-binding protein [uncultured Sulfurovum sp.]